MPFFIVFFSTFVLYSRWQQCNGCRTKIFVATKRIGHILLPLLASILLIACTKSVEIEVYNVAPEASFVHMRDGQFALRKPVAICLDNLGQNDPSVQYFAGMLRKMRLRPSIVGETTQNAIYMSLNSLPNAALGPEGYLIEITPQRIDISANTETGLFYACQSFIQLLPDDVFSHSYRNMALPCGTILDSLSSDWRSWHLYADKYRSPKMMRTLLDSLAMHKINHMIWHLCDSSTWVMEIQGFPTLDAAMSASDIDDIVEYAESRHVQIVPQLDNMICCAPLVGALPRLRCDGAQPQLCLALDSTGTVIYSLLDAVMAVFQSDYLKATIGDDQSVTLCPRCMRQMHQMGLSNVIQYIYSRQHSVKQYIVEHARKPELPDENAPLQRT